MEFQRRSRYNCDAKQIEIKIIYKKALQRVFL